MHRNRFQFALIVSLTFLVYETTPVFACTPAPATPWFTEHIGLAKQNLPDEISLVQSDKEHIVLRNKANTSVYVQTILESGQIETRQITPQAPNDDTVLVIEASGQKLLLNGYLVGEIDDRNIIQDNRPLNVTLPRPQNIIIRLSIDQKSYPVVVSINYSLNKYYRPDSVDLFKNGCSRFYFMAMIVNPITLILALVIVIVVILFLTLLIYKKKKEPSQLSDGS